MLNKNYVLKKISKQELNEINKHHLKAFNYWLSKNIIIEPQTIKYDKNINYVWYRVDK